MSLTADSSAHVAVAPYPTIEPRLLTTTSGRESLAAYQQAGGYARVAELDRLLDDVEQAGVRGRGGAAFPIARKLATVRAAGGGVVVANGEEGEPASVKDRWLLRHRPHLVLDGLRLAAGMVGSEDLHVYVSDRASAASIERAIDELVQSSEHQAWARQLTVTVVEPAYVAGEETAVVQALNGGPALPTDKPPRPFEQGVGRHPTLVSNVETLANLPIVKRMGHARYREEGTDSSPGTFLLTLTGRSTGLYEVPYGLTLRTVLTWLGNDLRDVTGLLMGGYFSGVAGADVLDVPLDYDAMRAVGTGLGCGAVGVLFADDCPVAVSAEVMAYFARETAGQCGSCFNGTAAMSAVLGALVDRRAEPSDVERLRHWSTFLPGRGACGTLDGATNIAASLLRTFPAAVTTHLEGRCDTCAVGDRATAPPFAAPFPMAQHDTAAQEVPS